MSLPNLNLLTFELPQSKNCKYVLTSPRSLKACRKAKIKPVELLYKSLKEVENGLQGKENAQEIYQTYEKERQRKLGICRRFRNELLLKGFPGRQNVKETKSSRNSPKLVPSSSLPSLCSETSRKMTESQENLKNAAKDNEMSKMEPKHFGIHNQKETFDKKKFHLGFKKEQKTHTARFFEINEVECNDGDPHLSKGFIEKLDLDNLNEKDNMLPSLEKKSHTFPKDVNNNGTDTEEKRPSSSKKKRDKKLIDYRKKCLNFKMQYADPEYCVYKYKQIVENSIDRDLRELDVKNVQRQIEEGHERWQDRVLLLQWLDSERAQEKAARELGVKVERLQQQLRTKELLHTMNINKVKENEDVRAEILRREIRNKNKKILAINQEKERVMSECKIRAQTVQELRDQIRNILTPDTFDKKVSKYKVEKKVLSPTGMCPRIMQRSHIRLG